MAEKTIYLLVLDDYHGGDVLFLQGLCRALSRRSWMPAPVIVHGSGEHAEHLLESQGIFRSRFGGVLAIESPREHALVERALRTLNRKITALLTDAVVSSVGVVGAQRSVFEVRDGRLQASGAEWLADVAARGVVSVVGASARDPSSEATGEVALSTAVVTLGRRFAEIAGSPDRASPVEVVFFTKTNLPGVMRGGAPRETVDVADPVLEESVSDRESLAHVVAAGLPVLLTNSNRLVDAHGPAGSRIVSDTPASIDASWPGDG